MMISNQTYCIKTPKNAQTISKDVIVINRNIFCTPEEAERVRQTVIEQLKEDGVAMLPVGFTAVVAERDFIFWEGEEDEQIH